MPPNRRIWILLLCLMLSILSAATVYAHPGATDENGGHIDHSTGEYHYHHGYPEHTHYDIDGDGTIDCPYDFDDKTGQNSGPSTGGNSGHSSIITKPSQPDTTFPIYDFPTLPEIDYTFPEVPKIPTIPTFSTATLKSTTKTGSEGNGNAVLYLLLAAAISMLFLFVAYRTLPGAPQKIKPETLIVPPSSQENIELKRVDAEKCPVPNSDSPPYRLCHLLWIVVFEFCKRTKISNIPRYATYLWTTFFYILIKNIRKQKVADLVYLDFPTTAKSYFGISDAQFETVLGHYRFMRRKLIECAIDPRTDEGLKSLWRILSKQLYIDTEPHEKLFLEAAHTVVNLAPKVYPIQQPKDSISQFSLDDDASQPELPSET